MTQPLLTQVMVGRNDHYLGNFKQRMELAVNYTCLNVERSGNLASYELLICDWNSDTPLRQALNLNQAALKCVKFLEVPPSMVSRLGLDSGHIHLGVAVNVPVRRADGQFIMVTPADVLFSFQAVTSLFALLRGEAGFPSDINNCYLGIERYLIPWQASERLRLHDLDRYFLLHTTHMAMGMRYHSLAGGEGAHLLSRKLWHELRGVNETYAAWGAHEVDLARRAAQFVPQLKGSLAGVYVYDLQQRPQVTRKRMKNNDVISLQCTVNNQNWGLAQADIPRVPAECCPDVNNAGCPPLPFDGGGQRTNYYKKLNKYETVIIQIGDLFLRTAYVDRLKKKIIKKLLTPFSLSIMKFCKCGALVFNIVFKFCAEYWIAQNTRKQKFSWFCDEWFGERPKLLTFFVHAWRERLYMGNHAWRFQTVCFALAVLATVGRQRPTRFFHAGCRNAWVAQFAAFADPTLEITGYDHWQGKENGGDGIHNSLKNIDFKGYYHLLTGPLETAFERLRNMPFGREPYQCLALDLDFLQPVEPCLYPEIAPLLADSCTMILGGDSKKQNKFGSALLKEGFQVVGLLPGVSIYMRHSYNCTLERGRGMSTHPYKLQPQRAFWDSAVSARSPLEFVSLYEKKFKIASLSLATAGSCFAQHIGRALKARGMKFLDVEPAPVFLPESLRTQYGFGIYSARYGNIYTTRQLVQLFDRAFGAFCPKMNVWTRDDGYIDPFRPNVEPEPYVSLQELEAQQSFHLEKVRELFSMCQVFIFTLGLTEVWLHAADGAAYPVVPGTRLGGRFDPEQYTFHNLDYTEVVADLERFHQQLLQINPGCKMLLTVSPVPLTATATDQHVLVANLYSKSVLRAAAGYLARKYDSIDYFPSYEIIAAHPSKAIFFMPDGRSVSPAGVEHVMGHFFAAHGILDAAPAEITPEPMLDDDPICEEMILGAFREAQAGKAV